MSLFLSNYNLEKLSSSTSNRERKSLSPLPPTVMVSEEKEEDVIPMELEEFDNSEEKFLGKNYNLIELKGKGAQGEVWEAINEFNGKKIALKIINIQSKKQYENAEQEVISLEKLSNDFCHPFIVCYIDHLYDAYTRKFYIEMQYIEGDNLEVWGNKYRGDKKFLNNLNLLIIDICNALIYIHGKEIIHRDIKPANIVISQGVPKLIDFGLSCVAETCQTGNVEYKCCLGKSGTLAFMPPETLITGKSIYLSDMWSLGATFFFVATGKLCFNFPDENNIRQVMDIVSNNLPFRLATSNFLLNQSVNACLNKDTKSRANPQKILDYYGISSNDFFTQ
jgi:serine/threonine protein kinase